MDRDLFMDIHFSATHAGEPEIAEAALNKAVDLGGSISGSSSVSSHSACSQSSCSECSDTASAASSECETDRETNHRSHHQTSQSQRVRPVGRSGSDSTPTFSYPPPISVTSTVPVPPLPVVTNLKQKSFIGYSPSTNPLDTDNSTSILYSTNYTFSNPHVGGLGNPPYTSTSAQFNPKIADNSSRNTAPPSPAVTSNERPKVKFCDTVMQITLPERLHTLMEEEEELPPYYPSPTPPQALPDPVPVHTAHFTSVNPINANGKQPRARENVTISPYGTNLPSVSFNWQEIPVPCRGVPRDAEIQLDVNKNTDQPDSLDTEELSALLPGSRRPVSSGTPSLTSAMQSLTFESGILKSTPADKSYFINYSASVHDLSEEEENNGSIKIVHFGVV